MGRKRNCWDCVPAESFFSSLKCERMHCRDYEIKTAAIILCLIILGCFITENTVTRLSVISCQFSFCTIGSTLDMIKTGSMKCTRWKTKIERSPLFTEIIKYRDIEAGTTRDQYVHTKKSCSRSIMSVLLSKCRDKN